MRFALRSSVLLCWSGVMFGMGGCGNGGSAPKGMVAFHGGEFIVGTDSGEPNEGPPFTTQVDPFFIDEHPVTVAQFRKFIEASGYETEAEHFGNSAVFNVNSGTWTLTEGATWRFPLGPGGPRAEDNHPVTQVSWNDAQEYCRWAGRRLPTEIEWEYAAANGKREKTMYSWGNELVVEGAFKANVWQGRFPDSVDVQDGFLLTSPVGTYGKTEAGLADMGGNVWEWCQDPYRLYQDHLPADGIDPDLRVIRGGSFLCDEKVCHGYRVTARSHNSRESATIHMGFRTAMNVR